MRGLAGIDIDRACVKKADLRAAYATGDERAIDRMRAMLQDVDLYFHGFVVEDDEMVVPISVLHEIGVIQFVKIDCGWPTPWHENR